MKQFTRIFVAITIFLALASFALLAPKKKVQYSGFTVYWNQEARMADHCWYTLTKRQLDIPKVGRCTFIEDPALNDITLPEYVKSGYDRGHLVPSADMEWSSESCHDAFYMSNMAPQYPSFNRGEWKSLEMKVREIAKTEDSIVVMVGPIFDKPIAKCMDKGLPVPTRFWKVVYAPKSGKKWAWMMPHLKEVKPYESYACNQDSLLKVLQLTIQKH